MQREREEWLEELIGKSVVSASLDDGTLRLSDGTTLFFQKSDTSCCSWIDLVGLATTSNVITSADLRDNEDETGGFGPYEAWVHVVTEAGEFHLADAEGNATSGYYLHGFALGVTVVKPSVQDA